MTICTSCVENNAPLALREGKKSLLRATRTTDTRFFQPKFKSQSQINIWDLDIIIIFLLLSKALFQTYWRTAIRWGWSENLLGQVVVWNTAGVGARTAVPWHGNLERCLLTSLTCFQIVVLLIQIKTKITTILKETRFCYCLLKINGL